MFNSSYGLIEILKKVLEIVHLINQIDCTDFAMFTISNIIFFIRADSALTR